MLGVFVETPDVLIEELGVFTETPGVYTGYLRIIWVLHHSWGDKIQLPRLKDEYQPSWERYQPYAGDKKHTATYWRSHQPFWGRYQGIKNAALIPTEGHSALLGEIPEHQGCSANNFTNNLTIATSAYLETSHRKPTHLSYLPYPPHLPT